jgi:hypothetical protein
MKIYKNYSIQIYPQFTMLIFYLGYPPYDPFYSSILTTLYPNFRKKNLQLLFQRQYVFHPTKDRGQML